uniref:Outer membrane protein-like protein n=1 Tax=Sphingobacterium sp. (strain 21) TaxID=743722 RepID=F4CBR8_SPHS2
MKNRLILWAAGVILALSSCGNASNKDAKETADSINESMADTSAISTDTTATETEDAKFATEAASGGLAEVELGKLAEQKASDAKVKEFGAMMVKDHSKANEELKALAAKKNIALPAAPAEEKQKKMQEISAKTGADFDKAYVEEMLADHKKDVTLFEEASNKVQDPEMKQFIDKTLPVLRTHLDHIQKIAEKK